jgi:Flp pilus assembly protein TadG
VCQELFVPIIQKFISDKRGNVAMMFGLAALSLFGIGGLALDYTRATQLQTKVAAAADSAALAAAKVEGSEADRKKVAEDVFNAAIASLGGVGKLQRKGKDVKDGSTVTAFRVEASLEMDTMVGALVGQSKLPISTSSQATVGGTEKFEIALVLDTTGSMQGAKLDALKVAAKNLVSTVSAKAKKVDQARFAVVPFSQWVNVGLANRNETWIDVPADYTETKTVDVYTYPNRVDTNCRQETRTGYNDGVPYTYQATVCDTVWGDPVITPTQQTYDHKWNGCVGSRNYPLDTQDGTYTTRVPGLLNHWCPGTVLPLTSDVASVNAAIDGMSAYGQTYIPSGLIWGWRVLSPGVPFNESKKATDPKVSQVLILMTDGANTKSAQYPDHWGTDAAAANTITSEVCANINAAPAGIKVYTIAFEVTDPTIKSILQTCAASADRFFDAANSAQLASAFQKIATSLAKLRLEK